MNILFVRNYPSVDGVFTLLLRLANQFKQDGHKMFYIDFGIKTVFEAELAETFTLLTLENLNTKKDLPHIDVLFPFADGDLLYWCISELKNKHFKNAKFVMGMYHPRAYYISTHLGPSPDTRMYKKLFRMMPSENVVFMNEIIKKNHQDNLNLQFANSPIIPLPVKLESRVRDFGNVNRKKIVSIGRLENSKKYIIAMIEVVEKLNNEGYNYDFYIYGHGHLKEFIINYIKSKNIEHYIFFMGELAYKNLFFVLKDAFMFIGMGTVIIEASSMGIPSLQAIDSERKHVSYGFFSELRGLSVGEINENYIKVSIKECINNLAEKNEEEYYEFSSAHIKRANLFDINEVIKQYYDFFNNASSEINIKLPSYKLYIIKIIRQFYKFKAVMKLEH